MGIIRADEIRGFSVDERILCPDCAATEKLDGSMDLTPDNLIVEGEMDEDFYFCDECKKRF
jgi:hypothetical protein